MIHPRRLQSAAPLFVAALAVTAMHAKPADACGGLFCMTTPVDQNAERILFEVHEPGTISAVVEIRYTGDPEGFSWIVPVPETPSEVEVAPPSALRLLDAATAVNIIPPPTTCSEGALRGGPFAPPSLAGGEADFANDDGDPGVVVEDLPVVGPFDPEVISSDDPQLLISWLEDNNYTITDEMKPFIEEYVDDGYKFLGVKLTPDAGVADISPLKFTCPNPTGNPLIPLKLTAVASEPEMGIMVFVAGSERYAPINFRNIEVDTDLVQFDPANFTSNYYPLVSWLVDQEGGKAFVTEYATDMPTVLEDVNNANLFANDAEESRIWLENELAGLDYMTRMYSRISGWEMDDDPTFGAIDAGDIENVHDLSGRPPIEVCSSFPEPVPCGNMYCGQGSECAVTEDGQEGCLCAGETVARAINAPTGRFSPGGLTVTCQDASLDLLQSASDQIADPCDGFSCGDNGTCMPVNGFPTCGCDSGFAAVNNFNRPMGLRCEPVVNAYAPEQLLWPESGLNPLGSCACAEMPLEGGTPVALAGLLFGFAMTLRRRRR